MEECNDARHENKSRSIPSSSKPIRQQRGGRGEEEDNESASPNEGGNNITEDDVSSTNSINYGKEREYDRGTRNSTVPSHHIHLLPFSNAAVLSLKPSPLHY